jgi:hypothetical protein
MLIAILMCNDCKLFSMIDSVSIPNSFAILVSGAPAIDQKQMI